MRSKYLGGCDAFHYPDGDLGLERGGITIYLDAAEQQSLCEFMGWGDVAAERAAIVAEIKKIATHEYPCSCTECFKRDMIIAAIERRGATA